MGQVVGALAGVGPRLGKLDPAAPLLQASALELGEEPTYSKVAGSPVSAALWPLSPHAGCALQCPWGRW